MKGRGSNLESILNSAALPTTGKGFICSKIPLNKHSCVEFESLLGLSKRLKLRQENMNYCNHCCKMLNTLRCDMTGRVLILLYIDSKIKSFIRLRKKMFSIYILSC